jgi:carbamoylphosphate synthase large subunit
LFSGGSRVANHAPFAFQHHAHLPRIDEPGWVDQLNRLIAAWKIDHIFPAYDDVLLALARSHETVEAKVLTSPLATCEIARSKTRTYQRLAAAVPVPETYASVNDVPAYPVFVKPDRGQGSERSTLVRSRHALLAQMEEHADLIVLEHLPGREYTVDCFSDRDRGVLFVGGRERLRTKAGIAMTSRTVNSPVLEQYARAIAERLEFHGPWFFQAKEDETGKPKVLEVAPRIAGTSAANRARGVNLPLLTLYEAARLPFEIAPLDTPITIDRALTNRYATQLFYSTVYLDLDDTLLFDGKVHLQVIRFVFQCINRRIPVVLLTRHRGDLDATLRRHRIANLFDRVIRIDGRDAKAAVIRENDAILIDDSFRERRAVAAACGIPTFDLSMLELLLDDKS